MFVNDIQIFQIFLYFRIGFNMNVTDINVNLIDRNIMLTSKIKFCLHSFYYYFIHSLILRMEFVFLIVQPVQKILDVWNLWQVRRKEVEKSKVKDIVSDGIKLLWVINSLFDILKNTIFLSLLKIKNKFTNLKIFQL